MWRRSGSDDLSIKTQHSVFVSPCYALAGGISMLQELERKRTELMQEVHAITAAIKAYAETIGQHHAGALRRANNEVGQEASHVRGYQAQTQPSC
jgi:vacuolar-type H+-ATPase subunit D/Vma8